LFTKKFFAYSIKEQHFAVKAKNLVDLQLAGVAKITICDITNVHSGSQMIYRNALIIANGAFKNFTPIEVG